MRFLHGKTDPAADDSDQQPAGDAAATPDDAQRRSRMPGKGRPTPSRRESEARKRGPAPPPPKNQREALRRMRESKTERRKAAAVRRERMLAGDEKYLLPRDRGPVKAYVRDLVDSRRNIAGVFMPLALLVALAILLPSAVQQYATLLSMAVLVLIIAEGLVLSRIISRRVRERFPDASASPLSLGLYAMSRATQLRKLRVPKPRVGRGDPVP